MKNDPDQINKENETLTPAAQPTKAKVSIKANEEEQAFKVRIDGDRFYIPIPKRLADFFKQKRLYFGSLELAIAEAEALNKLYGEEISRRMLRDAMSYLELLRNDFGFEGNVVDVLREKHTLLAAIKSEPSLAELQRKLVQNLIDRKQRAHTVDNIKLFRVPWPELRLIEFANRQLKVEKIQWLKKFLGEQIDFRTGEPWKDSTKRAYVNKLNQIINYAINNSETDLAINPFSKSVVFKVDWDPEIFQLDDLELFLTYLYHWYPKLYVPFVLGTWGGIRTEELKRMTYGAIRLNQPGGGWIKLDHTITKMKKTRLIREKRVTQLFVLLRMAPLGMGHDDAKLVENTTWESDLFDAWREIMFKPFPHNGMRHTAASMLLEARGMAICGTVLGHDFRDTDKVLLDHYRSLVDEIMTERFYKIAPQRKMTPALDASYKYRLYTAWLDASATTRLWPNCRMHYMHQMNTGSPDFERNLRVKRPIFATAVGRDLVVDIIHPDGTRETKVIPCQRQLWAKKLEHRWRVAIYTGQGTLNFTTGHVEHYELNFGPLWGQKLFVLENPEFLLQAVKDSGEGVRPIARKVGCSTDILCNYMSSTRTKWTKARVLPERFMRRLAALFPDLLFSRYTPKNATMAWVSAGVDDVENAPARVSELRDSRLNSR